MTYFSSAADLVIESDAPLPGLCPARGPASFSFSIGVLDSAVRSVEWIQEWTRDGRCWLIAGRVDAGYLLRFPDVADVLVDIRGRRIVAEARSTAVERTIPSLVAGHVVPRLLSLNGTPVLHASAVASGDGAIVFAGESGAGKSTLAAALCRAGLELLADDFVVLDDGHGAWVCPPTSSCVNLSDAAAELVRQAVRPAPVRASGSADRRLCAIYLLQPAGEMPAIEQVRPRDAFLRLFRLAFRMDPAAQAVVRVEFARLAALAGSVPVRLLRVPRDPRRLPASIEAILHPRAGTPA